MQTTSQMPKIIGRAEIDTATGGNRPFALVAGSEPVRVGVLPTTGMPPLAQASVAANRVPPVADLPWTDRLAAVTRTLRETQAVATAWAFMAPFLTVGPFFQAPPVWIVALMWPRRHVSPRAY